MRNFLLFTSIFILTSCISNDNRNSKNFRNLTSDTLFNKSLYKKASELNLRQFNNGVDSFELRVWFGLALAEPKQLIILNYNTNDSSWHLTETDYWISLHNNYPKQDYFSIDSSFTKNLNPSYPISNILDSISTFRLDTLPSQHEISGFVDNVADGTSFTIEIATKNFYKAIHYNNPKFYKDPYNRRITEILDYFGKSINVTTFY